MAGQKARARVSKEQKEQLVIYMENHPLFARGQITKLGCQGKRKFNQMWDELKNLLHTMSGANKTVQEWQNVWKSIKSTAKEKSASYRSQKRRTGNPVITAAPPTLFEEKVANIFGVAGTGQEVIPEAGFRKINIKYMAGSQVLDPSPDNLLRTDTKKIIRQPSKGQMTLLVHFIEKDEDIARGVVTKDNKHKFTTMIDALNSVPKGNQREMSAWLKCLSNLKSRVKQQIHKIDLKENCNNTKVLQAMINFNLLSSESTTIFQSKDEDSIESNEEVYKIIKQNSAKLSLHDQDDSLLSSTPPDFAPKTERILAKRSLKPDEFAFMDLTNYPSTPKARKASEIASTSYDQGDGSLLFNSSPHSTAKTYQVVAQRSLKPDEFSFMDLTGSPSTPKAHAVLSSSSKTNVQLKSESPISPQTRKRIQNSSSGPLRGNFVKLDNALQAQSEQFQRVVDNTGVIKETLEAGLEDLRERAASREIVQALEITNSLLRDNFTEIRLSTKTVTALLTKIAGLP